ncbi:MAG: gamma-glutamylcyclotransferase [Marinobacter sp.]|uniref:gamma-glutamylcyclotransferase n=1 Tax=Marinobacter sp. TaxID=50741 RepID=UPI00299E40BD|nr:gamma-glutamylcyclotransferase [Marinobacter sp.]MDX1757685.1 gamma-glutamylcyclotransferase [Marinobacter sp.]
MSFDTTEHNRRRFSFDGVPSVWLFGYGSLIYKVDFPFLERRPAHIHGWVRRFWQGSHDHRGTPEAPGRVVTLIEQANARCRGMAYRIAPDVFDHLDVREKNGYLRFSTELAFDDGTGAEGLVYIATEDNAAYLGPAHEAEIARQIAASHGPSGRNDEYLIKLAEALRELGDEDPHVFEIERYLR